VSFNVHITADADLEFQLSAKWYEEQQEGLGDKFISEVREYLLSIARDPEIYPKRIGLKQEATLKIFPFIILFRVIKRKDIVFILAIFHTSRDPKIKRYRK